MTFSNLMGLLACNLLWSAAYSVSKGLMTHYRPAEVSFLRYFAGALPLLVYCLVARGGGQRSLLRAWAGDLCAVDLRIVIVGVLTFFISPMCQMTGLHLSRAIDGSLMIAMEPLFTIVAAVLLLRERLRPVYAVSLAIAVVGAGVLTELTWEKFIRFSDARFVGNSIFMLSMVSEAAYSTVAKPALGRRSPALFMTVAVWVGVVLLFAYNLAADGPERLAGLAPLFQRVWVERQWADLLSVLYLGLGCTAFAYLFWMRALASTPVSVMALTLYVQPVLGVVWGHVFLDEALKWSTYAGAALILAALWLGGRPPEPGRG